MRKETIEELRKFGIVDPIFDTDVLISKINEMSASESVYLEYVENEDNSWKGTCVPVTENITYTKIALKIRVPKHCLEDSYIFSLNIMFYIVKNGKGYILTSYKSLGEDNLLSYSRENAFLHFIIRLDSLNIKNKRFIFDIFKTFEPIRKDSGFYGYSSLYFSGKLFGDSEAEVNLTFAKLWLFLCNNREVIKRLLPNDMLSRVSPEAKYENKKEVLEFINKNILNLFNGGSSYTEIDNQHRIFSISFRCKNYTDVSNHIETFLHFVKMAKMLTWKECGVFRNWIRTAPIATKKHYKEQTSQKGNKRQAIDYENADKQVILEQELIEFCELKKRYE